MKRGYTKKQDNTSSLASYAAMQKLAVGGYARRQEKDVTTETQQAGVGDDGSVVSGGAGTTNTNTSTGTQTVMGSGPQQSTFIGNPNQQPYLTKKEARQGRRAYNLSQRTGVPMDLFGRVGGGALQGLIGNMNMGDPNTLARMAGLTGGNYGQLGASIGGNVLQGFLSGAQRTGGGRFGGFFMPQNALNQMAQNYTGMGDGVNIQVLGPRQRRRLQNQGVDLVPAQQYITEGFQRGMVQPIQAVEPGTLGTPAAGTIGTTGATGAAGTPAGTPAAQSALSDAEQEQLQSLLFGPQYTYTYEKADEDDYWTPERRTKERTSFGGDISRLQSNLEWAREDPEGNVLNVDAEGNLFRLNKGDYADYLESELNKIYNRDARAYIGSEFMGDMDQIRAARNTEGDVAFGDYNIPSSAYLSAVDQVIGEYTPPELYNTGLGRSISTQYNPLTASLRDVARASGFGVGPQAERKLEKSLGMNKKFIREQQALDRFYGREERPEWQIKEEYARDYFNRMYLDEMNPDAISNPTLNEGILELTNQARRERMQSQQSGGYMQGSPTPQYGVTVNKLHNFPGDFMDSAMMAAGTGVYANGGYTRNQDVFLQKLANLFYGSPNEDFDVKTKPNIKEFDLSDEESLREYNRQLKEFRAYESAMRASNEMESGEFFDNLGEALYETYVESGNPMGNFLYGLGKNIGDAAEYVGEGVLDFYDGLTENPRTDGLTWVERAELHKNESIPRSIGRGIGGLFNIHPLTQASRHYFGGEEGRADNAALLGKGGPYSMGMFDYREEPADIGGITTSAVPGGTSYGTGQFVPQVSGTPYRTGQFVPQGTQVTYLPEIVVTPQDGYTMNRDAGEKDKYLTPKQQTLPDNLKEAIIESKMKNEGGVNKAMAGMVVPPDPRIMTNRFIDGTDINRPIDYNTMDASLLGQEQRMANAFNNANIPNGGTVMAADGMRQEDMAVNNAIQQYRNEMYLKNGGMMTRGMDAFSPPVPMGPSNLSQSLVNTGGEMTGTSSAQQAIDASLAAMAAPNILSPGNYTTIQGKFPGNEIVKPTSQFIGEAKQFYI